MKVLALSLSVLAGFAAFGESAKLLFHAPFDGCADAKVSCGDAKPVAESGLEFGPGYKGQAVHLTANAKSVLTYAAQGNIDWRRGSMSFWLKRDALPAKNPQAILALGKGAITGRGRFSFAIDCEGKVRCERDDIRGRVVKGALRPEWDATNVWEHWIVTWSGRDRGMRVYCGGDRTREWGVRPSDEEMKRIMPNALTNGAEYVKGVLPPDKFFIGCGAADGIMTVEGWIDDVRIFDRPFSAFEVKRIFDGDRKAAISISPHFALAGETKKISAEVKGFDDADLKGSIVELTDGKGCVVASAAVKGGGAVSLDAMLPMGAYSCRLVKNGEILARDDYTVLRAENPYELPPTATPGEPRKLRHVKTIKADLATLGENEFRAVGKCAMRELDGVPYLEGGRGDKDRFAIRFSLPTNAPLYLFEIVYPDDKYRMMDIIVQATDPTKGFSFGNGSGSGDYGFAQGLSTGGEFPNSMKMLSHRSLYWSGKSDDLTLVAMAWRPDAPAAISEIRIYEVVDAALPVADVQTPDCGGDAMGRQFGQFWEDPAVTGAIRFNMSTPESFSEQIDRYAAVMRYCGQNVLSYPGGWYSGLITEANDPRRGTHVDHYLEGYYAKFEREGMFVMPNIEFIHVIDPPDIEPTPETLSDGSLHPTQYPIHSDGRGPARFNHGLPPVCNFFHPKTQNQIEKMIRALVKEGAPYKSFKGISLQLYRDGAGWWGDIKSGYNDYCIDAFERDTGIKVPVDRADPLRGKAYYEWLMANCREKWVDWRCDKVAEFYAGMAAILREARSDLRLWFIAGPKFDAVHELDENPDYFDESFVGRSLRDAGLDGEKLAAAIPDAILGVTVHPQRQRKRWYWAKDARNFARYTNLPASQGYYAEIRRSAFPHVTLRDEFMEYDTRNIPAGDPRSLSGGWLKEMPWRCSTINAPGFHAMRYFAVPLRYGDVLGFTRGSFLVCDYGYESLEAQFAREFRALPAVKFDDLPCGETVKLRRKDHDGACWFYVVNTDGVEHSIDIEFPDGTVALVGGEKMPSGQTTLLLPPYTIRSFRAPEGAMPKFINAEPAKTAK